MKYLLIAAGVAFLWWLWRNAAKGSSSMSRAQAEKLLGVPADSDAVTILEAHKRLIGKVHPDAGGSAELAAQINQARDILLKHLSQ
jgi:DnaJ homolog subfamily C member 19